MTRKGMPPPPGSPRHGKRCTYVSYGCRCELCTVANRVGCEAAKRRRIERQLPADDPRHGEASTYTNWGCRCEPCTKAQTERCKPYQRKWRALNRTEINDKRREHRISRRGQDLPPGDPRHGTSSGYHYWCCRCDKCRAWEAVDHRKRYLRRKERAGG